MATFKVKVVNYQEKVLEQEAEFLLVRLLQGVVSETWRVTTL